MIIYYNSILLVKKNSKPTSKNNHHPNSFSYFKSVLRQRFKPTKIIASADFVYLQSIMPPFSI